MDPPKAMSQALRERLKRIGRVYSSPVASKRPHRKEDEEEEIDSLKTTDDLESGRESEKCCAPNQCFHSSTTNKNVPSSSHSCLSHTGTSSSHTEVLNSDLHHVGIDGGLSELTSERNNTGSYCSSVQKVESAFHPCITVLHSHDDNIRENIDSHDSVFAPGTNPPTQTQTYVPETSCKDSSASQYDHCCVQNVLNVVSPSPSGEMLSCDPSKLSSTTTDNVSGGSDTPGTGPAGSSSSERTDNSTEELKRQKKELLTRLNQKEELLRKLNMVKMYRNKNDLADLQALIDKWRTISQDALQELVDIANDPKPTLTELVDYFHLDPKLIGFNPDDESFSVP